MADTIQLLTWRDILGMPSCPTCLRDIRMTRRLTTNVQLIALEWGAHDTASTDRLWGDLRRGMYQRHHVRPCVRHQAGRSTFSGRRWDHFTATRPRPRGLGSLIVYVGPHRRRGSPRAIIARLGVRSAAPHRFSGGSLPCGMVFSTVVVARHRLTFAARAVSKRSPEKQRTTPVVQLIAHARPMTP